MHNEGGKLRTTLRGLASFLITFSTMIEVPLNTILPTEK
jgi:hypothetical protein